MARIISKPKHTWQEQVLIKLRCWMRIAQKQSMKPNFFYSMILIRVQICIYHIGNNDRFSLEDMTEDECKAEFRFLREDIYIYI